MAVLVTRMTNTMKGKEGYISPVDGDELSYSNVSSYIFNKCLKVKNKDVINKWVCYWEGLPFALVCDVSCNVQITGYNQIVVLTRKVLPVSEIGEYPFNKNSGTCFDIGNGRIGTPEKLHDVVSERVESRYAPKSKKPSPRKKGKSPNELSQAEIDEYKRQIAENWGITLK